MKKFLFFIIGLLLGAFLYSVFMIHKNSADADMGFVPFDSPSECLQDITEMRVITPFSKGLVLTTNGIDYKFIVYLVALDDKNESKTNRGDILKLDKNECYRQIGNYSYINQSEDKVTLPVINIMEK